jgi:hypothetical protein
MASEPCSRVDEPLEERRLALHNESEEGKAHMTTKSGPEEIALSYVGKTSNKEALIDALKYIGQYLSEVSRGYAAHAVQERVPFAGFRKDKTIEEFRTDMVRAVRCSAMGACCEQQLEELSHFQYDDVVGSGILGVVLTFMKDAAQAAENAMLEKWTIDAKGKSKGSPVHAKIRGTRGADGRVIENSPQNPDAGDLVVPEHLKALQKQWFDYCQAAQKDADIREKLDEAVKKGSTWA